MKAHQIIDRLARLDEAPVEEPQIEPDVAPTEAPPAPSRPSTRPSSDPYELPPDFDPGQMPRPKAEDDEAAAINDWLEATQQPITDWDWDGTELRLLMQDGTTEVYTREQLDEIGIFSGEMAFAESQSGLFEDCGECPEDLTGEEFAAAGPVDAPSGEATGVLDQILGRTPCAAPSATTQTQTIQVDGEKAEELANAVTDVVQAIIGIVGGDTDSEDSSSDTKSEKGNTPAKNAKDDDTEEDSSDDDDDEDEKDEDEDE
jgi:hypothetical protein